MTREELRKALLSATNSQSIAGMPAIARDLITHDQAQRDTIDDLKDELAAVLKERNDLAAQVDVQRDTIKRLEAELNMTKEELR